MLYLLANGQAQTRQGVAHLLGVHRKTMGRWLAMYAAGRRDALLATYVPAGKHLSLAPAVIASLKQALHRPEGFASYEVLRQFHARLFKVFPYPHTGRCTTWTAIELLGHKAESLEEHRVDRVADSGHPHLQVLLGRCGKQPDLCEGSSNAATASNVLQFTQGIYCDTKSW